MHKIIFEDIESIIAAELPWQNFSGKTVLISGAAGFLPSYMVHTLMHLNKVKKSFEPIKIIAVVRNKEIAEKRFAEYLNDKNFKLVVADMNEAFTLSDKLHYIIHAASQASPKYYNIDPVGTLKTNVFGTGELLKLAQKNPIEVFLYFSSGEVYGQTEIVADGLDELAYGYLDPMQVRSCYAESKRMGENLCVSWHHQYNIPTKIVRPFHTYGPGLSLNDGRVFADFVADIVSNRDIVMYSDGSATRAFCYLVDATIAFFTVLLNGEIGQAYNVANNRAIVSMLELAHTLIDLYPEKNLKVIIKERKADATYLQSPVKMTYPNTSKLEKLNWKPRYSIPEGFKRTIMSFTDN